MSEVVRQLERAHAEGRVPLEKVQDERVRHGLGWQGEELPRNDEGHMIVARPCDRGVYEWRLPDVPGELWISMVFVKVVAGKSFYIGLFPVTVLEWMRHIGIFDYGTNHNRLAHLGKIATDEDAFHPVTDISLDHAKSFAAWAGLRLPSQAEWAWAALGAPRPCDAGADCTGHEANEDGSERITTPTYPWGNQRPSPERCVWAGHPEYGPVRSVVESFEGPAWDRLNDRPGSTAPVLSQERIRCDKCFPTRDGYHGWACNETTQHFTGRLVPPRPLGASWCGAQDMCGNVWELTEEGTIMGGSFLSEGFPLELKGGTRMDLADPDISRDVGFRVAIDAL